MSDSRGPSSPPAPAQSFLFDEDLAKLLARDRRLRVAQAVDLLLPVVSALASAHDVGSVHGDLRPRNIMLSRRGGAHAAYVIGFGSTCAPAKAVERTSAGAMCTYLAPEQTGYGAECDPRSDQFALGAVLYECLTGEPAFVAGSVEDVIAKVEACSYRRPRHLEPSLPRALEAIIVRMLAKCPSDRFAGMRALGAALLPFASQRMQEVHVAEFGRFVGARRTRAWVSRGEGRPVRRTTWFATGRQRAVWGVTAGALGVLALLVGVALRGTPAVKKSAEPLEVATEQAPLPPAVKAKEVTAERRHAEDAPAELDAKRGESVPATRAPATFQIDLTVAPRSAWIMLDRRAAGGGHLKRELPTDGTVHELRVGAPGHEAQVFRFKDAPPPKVVVLEKKETRPRS